MSMSSSPPLQSFRVAPRPMPVSITAANIDSRGVIPILKVKARFDSLTGTYFILWRDVQTLYPKAEYVMDNSNVLVSFMNGTDLEQLKPPRISYRPGVVLNVALPSAPAASSVPSQPPIALENSGDSYQKQPLLRADDPIEKTITSELSIADKDEILPSVILATTPSTSFAPSKPPANDDISKVKDQKSPHHAANEPIETARHAVSELGISEKEKKGHHPLPKISPRVSGSLTGTEDTRFLIPSLYPHTKTWFSARTPRLFILLPSVSDVAVQFRSSSYPYQPQNAKHPVSMDQLRLYFFCESADGHTQPKDSHWVHLAQHPGSRIARPTEFLEEFGTYILAIMGALRTGFIQSFELGSSCSSAAKLAQELNKWEKKEVGLRKLARTDIDIYTEDSVVTKLDETIAFLEDLARKSPKMWRETGPLDKSSWREGGALWDHIDTNMKQYIPKNSVGYKPYGDLYKIISNDGYCQMVCQTHSHTQSEYDAPRLIFDDGVHGHRLVHLSFLYLDFSSAALATASFEKLALLKSPSELVLSLNWNVSEEDLKGITKVILQSSVVSLHLYTITRRGETVDAVPAIDLTRMDKQCAQRHEPILRMLATGKLQRFVFRGLPNLFWSLEEEEEYANSEWSLLGGLSNLIWGKSESWRADSFPNLLSADFRTLDVHSRILKKFTALRTLKMDFPRQATTRGTMLHCLLACPTLEEVEVHFSSTRTVASQLLSDVDSVLKLAPQWKQEGRSCLRSYRSIAPDGHLYLDFVSEGVKEMSPRFSFSLYGEGYLQLVLSDILLKYGWAMKILNLSQSWVSFPATWLHSIKDYQDKEGVWNIEELHLPRISLDYRGLRTILDKSPRLRSLTVPVTFSGGEWLRSQETGQEDLDRIIRYLGLWLTDLWLFDCPERSLFSMMTMRLQKPILPKLKSLLVDFTLNPIRRHSWLVNMIASNQKYFSLVNATPTLPHSNPSMSPTNSDNVEPLRNITLYGIEFQKSHDSMKKLLEAIEFSTTCSLIIVRSTFGEEHWNYLLECLPPDGLLPDGSLVPLRSLTLKHTSLRARASLNGSKPRQEQLWERAPLAKLTIFYTMNEAQ